MRATLRLLCAFILIGVGLALGPALAQVPPQDPDPIDPTPPGSLNPQPLPPLADPNSPKLPAKELFARKSTPFAGPPRSIGGYAEVHDVFIDQSLLRDCVKQLPRYAPLTRLL